MSQLESALEKLLRKEIKDRGGVVIKLVPVIVGIPDDLVLLPWGRQYFVELKADGGRLSPIQIHRHQELRAIGHDVIVLKGRNEILAWVQSLDTPKWRRPTEARSRVTRPKKERTP